MAHSFLIRIGDRQYAKIKAEAARQECSLASVVRALINTLPDRPAAAEGGARRAPMVAKEVDLDKDQSDLPEINPENEYDWGA